MSTSTPDSWKAALDGQIRDDWSREIDIFETQIQMRGQGKIEEKLFAETRLRRGAYGQRYDNGQRSNGVESQKLGFPEHETKGVDTVWDAPGMQRIKVPYGGVTAQQLEVLAECAEEYADGILHITTRQDIQLHFVHIDDTPDMMRRLASVGITTREACGNSVRNITGCPFAGICHTESFDVSPYADALTHFLLGHRDVQDFGRKFKIAFSGCGGEGCGVVKIHDMGFVAKTRTVDGKVERGFEFYVGGGLGAVPFEAKLLDEFLPEDELLPMSQAVCRVYARLGEKKSRVRARIKFLVKKLGFDEFKRLVLEERAAIPEDERWSTLEAHVERWDEKPLKPASELPDQVPAGFARWAESNVRAQAQAGYSAVTITIPLGDFTAEQARVLADIARKYIGDAMRTTVEQNMVLRWVSNGDLPDLYNDLVAARLAIGGASEITDVVSCPGTDTCKLGISSSRGLARQLMRQLGAKNGDLAEEVRKLHIKISGCMNSCGQHHISDLGFYGINRTAKGYSIPHFQVVLGGRWEDNGGAYGLALGAVPSKRVPDVVERITGRYVEDREAGESFQDFIGRIGRKGAKQLFADMVAIPDHDEAPEFYSDWGDPREYSLSDLGVGECAGEVVSINEFDMADSERAHFEAQEALEGGDATTAANMGLRSMVLAARALVKINDNDAPEDPEAIVGRFRTEFYDTKLIFDKYAGSKFADYLLRHHENPPAGGDAEGARQVIEEAQLFIDAAHSCYARMMS